MNKITTGKTYSKTIEHLFKDMFSKDPNRAHKEIKKESKQARHIYELNP